MTASGSTGRELVLLSARFAWQIPLVAAASLSRLLFDARGLAVAADGRRNSTQPHPARAHTRADYSKPAWFALSVIFNDFVKGNQQKQNVNKEARG